MTTIRYRRPLHLFAVLGVAAAVAACATSAAAPPTDAAPQCGAQNYPHHALENEHKGDVGLRVDVDAAGRVVAAAVQAPSVSRYLDAAALAGVRSCRFAAGGAPRRLDVVLAYRFLNESETPPQGVVTVLGPQAGASQAPAR